MNTPIRRKVLASELSPFSNRVRLAAALKGITLDVEPPPAGTGSAELKQIHPQGRIPVMLLGPQVLVESLALLEYLEDAWPGTRRLRPSDPLAAARMRMIALLFDHDVIEALRGVFAQVLSPAPDAAAACAAFDRVTQQLERVAYFFDADGPAVGGELTLADVAMAPFAFLIDALAPAFGAQSPNARVERFSCWWQQIAQVPKVAAVGVRMQQALAAMAAARAARRNS